jgi:hypothetical protein
LFLLTPFKGASRKFAATRMMKPQNALKGEPFMKYNVRAAADIKSDGDGHALLDLSEVVDTCDFKNLDQEQKAVYIDAWFERIKKGYHQIKAETVRTKGF